jgi:uncharacterized protein
MDIRKKIRAALVLCLALLLLAVNSLAAGDEKFPQPQGAVNDFAGVIPPEYRESMTNLAQEVFQKTGIAIVVATFPTIGDHSPEDFVNRLYEAWGIGKKGEDKGVLIFVAVKERKFRIETGYGVEEVLPDGLVGEIRDRYAIPFLRKGDYGRGLFNTVSAISDILARHAGVSLGEQSRGFTPPEQPHRFQRSSKTRVWTWIVIFMILAVLLGTKPGRFILFYLLLTGGGGRGGGFGGFGGGGFGGFGGGSSGGGGAGGDY